MVTPIQVKQNQRKTILLATNQSQSVIAQVIQGDVTPIAYTAYGHRSAALPPSTLLGFNGELSEPQTRWYLLGNGHRAYNPVLMRFHSSDKLSPFGAGGLNSYMFCVADPINYRDPTGRFIVPAFVSQLVSVAGGASSIGGMGLSLSSSARFSGQGILALGTGATGVLLGAAAIANPASVIAPALAGASMTAGAASIMLAYRAATAIGTQWIQRAARTFDYPPRYSTLSLRRNSPPSFSSLDLRPPPPYSPPSGSITIAPIHTTARSAPSSTGRVASNTRFDASPEPLLNHPERVTARISDLPQVQFIDETKSAAKQIRAPKR